MTHPRQPQTPLAAPRPVDASDPKPAPHGHRAQRLADRLPRPVAPDLVGASNRDAPVPRWNEARRALFGSGGRAGLLEGCRDHESLIAAAQDRHPYLAAYCAHMGRDRLAYAPIHDEENERGRRALEFLGEAYEAFAAVWEERRLRGLPLHLCRRGDLRKPDYTKALPNRTS